MDLPKRTTRFVFDMAGVLVCWNMGALYDPLFEASGRDRERFFSSVLDDDSLARISAGDSIPLLMDELCSTHPDWQAEIRLYWARWEEMLDGPIAGTVAVLEELRERGYDTYLLGNWGREEFERARPGLPFLEGFRDVLLSGDCGLLKPDPGIFELAEQRFGLEPASTVFIDDRADNVQAAVDRGWNGIVFEDPRQLYRVLMDYEFL